MKRRTDVEKRRWQRELEQERYDTGVIEFVNEVAAAACATGALSGLCPSGEWDDDALAEAVQGLWAGKLTEALPKALQTPSVGAMSRYIQATRCVTGREGPGRPSPRRRKSSSPT